MKTFAVLMSAYNGEAYIRQQIDSILAQRNVNVFLLVRDDGSSDGTRDILSAYERDGKLRWYGGENVGAKESFMDLLQKAPDADYYAFADQDDYWLPGKLARAARLLQKESGDLPALYFSDTIECDFRLRPLAKNKPGRVRALSFGGVLVKNNASGNTMAFNDALRRKIRWAEWRDSEVTPYHDHWTYMVCLALSGKVIADPKSYIYYRQHENNVVGSRRSFLQKVRGSGIIGHSRTRSRRARILYGMYSGEMADRERALLERAAFYGESPKKRLALALDQEIKPENAFEKINVSLMVMLGKF